MFAIEVIAEELRQASRTLEYGTFDGRDAARLTQVAAEVERLGSAIKLGFAKRAADTNGWHERSDARSSEDWLARLSGCSETQARETLQIAKRLQELPATEAKLRNGKLSPAQASAVTKAAAVAPEAEPKLLRAAARRSLRELASSPIASSPPTPTKPNRTARRSASGISARGATGSPLAASSPARPRRSTRSSARSNRSPRPASRKPARRTSASPTRPTASTRSSTSPAAPEPSRVCRSPASASTSTASSTTPVVTARSARSPASARCRPRTRRVLPYGLLELVITNGIDVRTVVTRTRHVPEALKLAIDERDQCCKVRDCGRSHRLERHHVDKFSEHRRTAYDVLGKLCGDHHNLVTYHGHEIVDHGDGTWSLGPPEAQRRSDAA